ncbi:unnamed protein product [Trichogramma brassicae]|uniref:BTB domain-containing protein n=1 Tax=Trichogramma brassicae TaxID=86971 RepID=A0A6H5HX16_9HYME|nr:unnamed protein product [Trichogramma brassicae]
MDSKIIRTQVQQPPTRARDHCGSLVLAFTFLRALQEVREEVRSRQQHDPRAYERASTSRRIIRAGGMTGQHYCLRWDNYQSNMTSVFHQLLQNEAFVDVTLACNEASLKAHKVVLSACSSYFQKLLLSNPCTHPTIIMPQDVCFNDLKFIIEFVYKGEIDVTQAELQRGSICSGVCVCAIVAAAHSLAHTYTYTHIEQPPTHTRKHVGLACATSSIELLTRRARPTRESSSQQQQQLLHGHDRPSQRARRSEYTTSRARLQPVVHHQQQQQQHQQEQQQQQREKINDDQRGRSRRRRSPRRQQPQEQQQQQRCQSQQHIQNCDNDVKVKFETLQTMDSSDTIDIDSHMSDRASVSSKADDNMMMITPELLGLMPSGSSIHSDSPGGENNSRNHSQSGSHHHGSKSWTQEDMDAALEALRNHDMSLTKASATFGIPSTTLWQRAHRLGIDTPKKDGPTKSWSDESLNNALEALRTGTISANKASKAFGIPSSTLYKIARREGIRLAAPFNASPTAWSPADLDRALEAIRSGQTSVQRASTEFGIPTGTLYGRCKREGIELSRSNPTPWSEDAMTDALEAVRLGHMSINQAAIHYNLPYSSLYGRFKRGKYEEPVMSQNEMSQDGSSQHFHHPSPTQNNHTSPLPEQMTYQGS